MEPVPDTSGDTLPKADRWSARLSHITFWQAPEDPDKPNLPYRPGFSIQVSRHAPPPAFSTAEELEHLGLEERPRLSQEYLEKVSHSQAVVANPPEQGIPLASPQAETADLVITSPIAVGSARGPQIVACRVVLRDGEPFTAVAKIYDPLYYSFEHSFGHYPRDTVFEADEDFMVETWAYEALQKAGQTGDFTPIYYGSWTFTLPIVLKGVTTERPVRMILMEHLNGVSIQASCMQNSYNREAATHTFHYPEEYRLEVLARAMDGYVRQMQAGVRQGDFAGCNIVLVPIQRPTAESEMFGGLYLPRIVLIDYDNADLEERPPDDTDSRPMNPVQTFWTPYLWSDIAGWVPSTWEKGDGQEEWLLKRFCGDDQRDLYHPVPAHISCLVKQRDCLSGVLRDGRSVEGTTIKPQSDGDTPLSEVVQTLSRAATHSQSVPGGDNGHHTASSGRAAAVDARPRAHGSVLSTTRTLSPPTAADISKEPMCGARPATLHGHATVHSTSSPGKEKAAPETGSSRSDPSAETDESPSPPPSPPNVKPGRDYWMRPKPKLPIIDGSLFSEVLMRQKSEK
ncbi:hypothetical protein KVR01_012813 [Diaporthe batatas]|uniref:uncharacterized protein n=1 Tax=Diaporthe batatas TaxID=748121 RepID=UPI001D052386|nr:uncharacterized protein KVR01_012813 [Diaporthe batatas]KAG8157429.1 hypothetical protein KVR01_012813 [Diaporthe batatas]